MRRLVAFGLCVSVLAIYALQSFAACNFVRVVTLFGYDITAGWPLDTNIRYWVDSAFIPSGIQSEFISAASTWDNQCNRISLQQTPVFNQFTDKGQVIPITSNWLGSDSAAARTGQDGFPVQVFFQVQINFQNFKRSGWTTASSCNPPIPANLMSARRVALHEMGHAIGLGHSENCPDNVMETPIPRGCVTMDLGNSDVQAAQTLYGCAPGVFQVAADIGQTCVPDWNPAADVSDFRVSNGVAIWTVLHEWETKGYVLEGCHGLAEAGVELTTDIASLGVHAVPIQNTEFPYVRLVEIETSGRRIIRAYDTVRKVGPSPAELAASVAKKMDYSHSSEASGSTIRLAPVEVPLPKLTPSPTVVMYTTSVLAPALLSEVVPFWEERGHVVEVVDVGAIFPAGTELEGIKASIGSYAENGTKYFHLVGDWEDDYPFAAWSSSAYWQSKYDAYRRAGLIPAESTPVSGSIPTYRYPDHERGPQNTAQQVPYVYTDQWYADTDADDVPDVVVTRWPFSDPSEVAAAAERLPLAHLLSHTSQRALFLVGEALPNGPGSIVVTRAMADDVKNRLLEINPQAAPTTMLESDYPDVSVRNFATALALNTLNPDLIVGLGTYSNEYHPCEFFVKESCTDPPSPPGWRMTSLNSNYLARLVLAASCSGAEWKSPTFICDPNGPDFPIEVVCKEFLANDGAGALAWVGPTTGSLQGGNYTVARYVVEELMTNPYRPMAESWLVAMQRAYFEASAEYIPTLMSYAFLGDPLSPFRRLPDRSITAKLRRTNNSEAVMPAAFAVGCPQGDRDKLVVEVSLDAVDVLAALPADAFTMSQPVNGSVIFFPENTPILADSTTSLVAQTGQHRTTFTVSSFSGCGVDSALVSLYGIPLGYAPLNVKSYDAHTGEYSRGTVNLPDFSLIGNAFVSSQCDCVYAKDYEPCVDYAMPDTTVNLVDLAEFWPHYNHEVPGGGSSPEAVSETTAGTVLIEFEEVHPLIGEHKLRAQVSLESVEPFELAVFALHNASPKLEFLGWTEAGDLERETICIEAERDGRKEVVIGVLGKDGQPSSATTLGTAEFRVLSDQQLVLGDEDLALVTADLLSTGSQRALAVSSMDVRRAVASVAYENALAQNYPNPFNPTTTISFSLARSANANLSIYDVRGSLVRRLVDERKDRGIHRLVWDGMNSGGQKVASGVYFYKLVAGTFTDTKKMTILK